jgi:hypothetical protein
MNIESNRKLINFNKLTTYIKKKKGILFILFIVILLPVSYFIYSKYNDANPNTEYIIIKPKQRDVVKSVSINGSVKSVKEINIGSDVTGKLIKLHKKVGDTINSGEILAEIENSIQKAQVTQAYGSVKVAEAQLSSAKAQLQKVLNGSTKEDKDIVTSQVSSSETSLSSALDTSRNVLQTAYAGTVNAILLGIDVMLDNPMSANPKLKFNTTSYSEKIIVENSRVSIAMMVDRHKDASAYKLANKDLIAEIKKVKEELNDMRKLTDNLLIALNGAIKTSDMTSDTLSSYIDIATNSRAQIL